MADNSNLDGEGHRRVHSVEHMAEQEAGTGRAAEPASNIPAYPDALLGDSRLKGRGNSPVQAAVMQRMQSTHGNHAVQRFLQRRAGGGAAAQDEQIGERIQAKAGSGSSLDGGVRQQLESGLGADMSNVRVHTDAEADGLARSVNSVAFTTGSDIFFRGGAYNPGSQEGMRLLAHEATHTVQQAAGPVAGTPAPGGVSISDPSDSYEQAAEQAANTVVSGGKSPAAVQATMASGGNTPVQREGKDEEEEEENEAVQTKRDGNTPVQRADKEEEEEENEAVQTKRADTYVQRDGDQENEQV